VQVDCAEEGKGCRLKLQSLQEWQYGVGVVAEHDLKRSVVASVHDTRTVSLDEPVSGSIRLIAAASGVLDAPTLPHVEPFGVPDVGLHPGAVFFLPQLVQVEQESEFSSMSAALRAGEDLTLVWVQLVEGSETDSHRDSVIVMGHASPSQVSGDQLDFHL